MALCLSLYLHNFSIVPKTLVIVESPTKAKTISRFLGKDYVVSASMGHIRDLPEKNLGIDVEKDYEPSYVVSRKNAQKIKPLKELLKKSNKVLLATDEDREGEAIAWHLLKALKIDVPYERIVFHEITKDAILNALKHPRGIDEGLVDAQQARRVLDRLVGYTLSPFLWSKVRKGLSAGRVQSVAVRLIVEKEREIQAFKEEEYWHIHATLQTEKKEEFKAQLMKINGKKATIEKEKGAKEVISAIGKVKKYKVEKITLQKKQRYPAPPFTTSTLQQEAARKLGFSVKKTMKIAQELYEGVDVGNGTEGLITYMRTDSVNLAKSALEQAAQVVEERYGKTYGLSKPRVYKTKSKGAQEAHEAIRPTNLEYHPDEIKEYLSKDQQRLYALVWKRTIATQMKEAEVEHTKALLYPEGFEEYEFQAKGMVITFPGFMAAYTEGQDDEVKEDGELPKLHEGEMTTCKELLPSQHFTKPPARYTEASLVKKLESEGIGRPSTYAPTISTIIDKGYVEKLEKKLHPTEIAFVVIDLLVKHFAKEVDYSFTAQMEEQFDQVAEGKMSWQKAVDDFFGPFSKLLEKKKKEVEKVVEKTGEQCEKCGHDMVIKFGRFGKFQACSNYPECKNLKPLEEEVKRTKELEERFKGEKCEKCGSTMQVKRGRFGEFLACSNYPECKTTKKIEETTGVTCPECKKGEITVKRSKKGRIFYGCNRYPDCKTAFWKEPVKKPCPECQGLMLKTKKDEVSCPSCGHKEAA